MAKKKNEKAPEQKAVKESMYKASEFAAIAAQFDTSSDCVLAAFRVAGKREATMTEAKQMIKKFITKEVE